MRVYRNKNIDYDARFDELEKGQVEPVSSEFTDVEIKESPFDSLVKVVYQVDPLFKLPTGDLTFFVSDRVNPDIKQFVLDNLMIDTSSAANVATPEGISSELAMSLARGVNEDVDTYRDRVNDFMLANKKLVLDAQKQATEKSIVPDSGQ